MKITSATLKDECVILPFWQKEGEIATPAFAEKTYNVQAVLATKDFRAKEGEALLYYPEKGPKRLLLLGLGKKEGMTVERYRRAYASAAKAAIARKIAKISLVVPEGGDLQGMAEGIALVNYSFDAYRAEKGHLIESIGFFKDLKKASDIFERAFAIAEGMYAARSLINQNADDVTPAYLADFAEKLASTHVKTKVYDKA
jgi:leucyl aminopeptidase